MAATDEPLFPEAGRADSELIEPDPGLEARIRHLVTEQPYGVLCTQGESQPYGSLIAFAFSANLSYAVFATPVATRKYRLLSQCDNVALVVDNRPDHQDMMMVEAVTATGHTRELPRGSEFDDHADLLVSRHPQLESFVKASSCALFRIEVVRFLHVTRFQEVGQWIPPTT